MKRGSISKEKQSTIRVCESTKEDLKNLDFSKKGMSYDDIIKILLKKQLKRGGS